ncbi:hypothetical protein [Nocardioides pakistanensis]
MTAPNLAEALVALMHETRLAEQHLADRQASAGGEALSALFAAPEPEAQVEPVAPACGSSEPVPASSGAADEWAETDARIEAARKAETPAPAPTPDPAPAASSEPGTDAALLAMLNTPTGETPA